MEVFVKFKVCDVYLGIYGGRLSKHMSKIAELRHFTSTT